MIVDLGRLNVDEVEARVVERTRIEVWVGFGVPVWKRKVVVFSILYSSSKPLVLHLQGTPYCCDSEVPHLDSDYAPSSKPR